MNMTPEEAAAVLRMCENIQRACPWAVILTDRLSEFRRTQCTE